VKAIDRAFHKGENAMRALNLSKIFIAALAVVATLASTAKTHAQVSPIAVTVNVPFEFDAGSLHFAPGRYTMSIVQDRLLAIQGGSKTALMEVGLGEDQKQSGARSRVVFHHYGNRYFLSEVRSGDNSEYLVCIGSKAERRARQQDLTLNRGVHPGPDTGTEVALVESAK
jgi:hypothetical protein